MEHDSTFRLKVAGRVVAASLASVLAFGALTAAAQDTDMSRPASIHTGACDSPGDVVAELRPLTVTFDDDDDDGGSGTGGAAQPTPTGTGGGGDDGGDDNADDGGATQRTPSGTGGGDDGGDDNADDGGTGGDDDADDGGGDDGGDDDADDAGSRLSGMNAFQSSTSLNAIQSGGQFVGAEDASVVEGSEDSDVGVGLDALLAEPHIVAVFEGEGSDTIIACGSIGGFTQGDDDDLAVGLREQNGSGFAGIAILDDDDDDDNLDVDVYIARDVVGGGGV